MARILSIPPQSGFDGEPWTFDLSPFLANNITVSFRSGYSKPAWLSLSNNVLSASALPAVSRSRQDDTYRILLTGTHASRSTNFEVELTVKYIEVPSAETAPAQTLDLRVTPTIPNVRPPLRTSVVLHMSDYITNLARAGTITYSIQFDDEHISALSTREVNGVSVNDVLTITAPTQPLADEPVSSVNLDIRATNAVGHASIDVPVDITNLMSTYLNNIPNQDIHRDEIDSINLNRYAGGRPRPTFALGTIVPTLTEDVATIVSNANGMWSVHPNANLETTDTYRVNVIAINRISRATGSFNMTIHGVPHTEPPIAPVWHTTGLTFNVNVGSTFSVDLATLINMSRPQPTFTLNTVTELTDVGARASITGTTLTVTAPSSMDLDSDYTARIQVDARNSAGGATGTLMINLHYVSAPVWSAIPHQSVRPGQTWTLDLKPFVSATPTAEISFNPSPSGIGRTASLTSGVVTWDVPDSETEDSVQPFTFQALNVEGSAETTVGVAVVTDAAPEWTPNPIRLNVMEGQMNTPFDLREYLTAGSPLPTLYLGAPLKEIRDAEGDITQAADPPSVLNPIDVPAEISFRGTTILITPTLNNEMAQQYQFRVYARNSSGTESKVVTLDVHPVFEHSDNIVLSAADYEEIRKLIDTKLSAQDLPDDIIAADAVIGGAVSWAINRMPVYPNNPRTLEELVSKRRAVIYRAAGILSASVRRSQDPRLTVLEVDEFQLQRILYQAAEDSAVIAQQRFVELGLTDDGGFDEILFRVVPCP